MPLPIRREDERGVTLVFVALVLTGALAVAALAIDGGRLFTARRQTQNAADAAALAGAQALYAYQYAPAGQVPTEGVWTAAQAKLAQNQASGAATCVLTDATGTPLSDGQGNLKLCHGAADADLRAAAGVQAGGAITQQAIFSGVVRVSQYSASASATATIQPLVAVGSPFISCGVSTTGWGFMKSGPGGALVVDGTKVGMTVDLESSQMPDCGAPSSKFKGKGAGGMVRVGDYEGIIPGNGYSASIANLVAGLTPCPSDIGTLPAGQACGMIVPVADGFRGGPSSVQMHIIGFAVFNVTGTGHGNPKYQGVLEPLDANAVAIGSGLAGQACTVGSQVCVINLVA